MFRIELKFKNGMHPSITLHASEGQSEVKRSSYPILTMQRHTTLF